MSAKYDNTLNALELAQEWDATHDTRAGYIGEEPFTPVDYDRMAEECIYWNKRISQDEWAIMTMLTMGEKKIKAYTSKRVSARNKQVSQAQIDMFKAIRELMKPVQTPDMRVEHAYCAGLWRGDWLKVTHKTLQDKAGDLATDGVRKRALRNLEKWGIISRKHRRHRNEEGAIDGTDLYIRYDEARFNLLLQAAQQMIKEGCNTLAKRRRTNRTRREGGSGVGRIAAAPRSSDTAKMVKESLRMGSNNGGFEAELLLSSMGHQCPDKDSYSIKGSANAITDESVSGNLDNVLINESDSGTQHRSGAAVGDFCNSEPGEASTAHPATGFTASTVASDEAPSGTSFAHKAPGPTPVVPPAPLPTAEAPALEWRKFNSGDLPGEKVYLNVADMNPAESKVYVWVKPGTNRLTMASYDFCPTTIRILNAMQTSDRDFKELTTHRKGRMVPHPTFYPEAYTFETVRALDAVVRFGHPAMGLDDIKYWLGVRQDEDGLGDTWDELEFNITELMPLIKNWPQFLSAIQYARCNENATRNSSYRGPTKVYQAVCMLELFEESTPDYRAGRQEVYDACKDIVTSRKAMLLARNIHYEELNSTRADRYESK